MLHASVVCANAPWALCMRTQYFWLASTSVMVHDCAKTFGSRVYQK